MKLLDRFFKRGNGKVKEAKDDPSSFGNIALEWRVINEVDLQEALMHQEARQPLGDILIALGKITAFERDQILLEQEKRRTSSSHDRTVLELKHQRLLIQHVSVQLEDIVEAAQGFVEANNGGPKASNFK